MNALVEPPPTPETGADPRGGGTGIGEAEVLYVDSRAGLEEAVHQGLRPDAEVRSTSPALVLDSTLDVTQADAHIPPADLLGLWRVLNESSRETFLRLRTELDSEALALAMTRTLFLSQNLLQKAMTLREDDFHRPVAVTVHEPSPADALGRLNGPWPELLSSNPQLARLTVPKSRIRVSYPLFPPNASFLSRILFADWRTIGYRLLLSLWDRLPGSAPRGCILIPNEGSLVKEAAFRLATRGFALKSLAPPRDRSAGTNHADPSQVLHVRNLVSGVVARPEFANRFAPSALAAVRRILEARIVGNMESYLGALADWREELDSLSADRPKAILCNNNMHPEMIALNEAAGERRIPFVMFDHGAARAFAREEARDEIMYETANADIFFTYTPVAADKANESSITRGRAIPVGAPRDHYRIRKRRGSGNNAPPIWYVSTMIYMGNVQGLQMGMTDTGMARYEIDVIDRVLAKLPYSVLYKPYPATRYADPCPVSERARSTANVTYYGEALDLRYLPASARVLVTSRGGSTQGWCMASRKPLVHVLYPGEPLTEEARSAFEEAIFLFDGRSPRMHDELVDFLSQPIAEIERLWERRAPARRELISRFFDCGHADAGTRAANLLVESGFDPARIP